MSKIEKKSGSTADNKASAPVAKPLSDHYYDGLADGHASGCALGFREGYEAKDAMRETLEFALAQPVCHAKRIDAFLNVVREIFDSGFARTKDANMFLMQLQGAVHEIAEKYGAGG